MCTHESQTVKLLLIWRIVISKCKHALDTILPYIIWPIDRIVPPGEISISNAPTR